MRSYSSGHLSNDAAWSSYVAAESRETADTATTLALLAEVDERRLYLPAGHGSMCDFCMQARHMSRARALKRIRVARAGREFPAIFHAIADGRLGLTAVLLLAPHLTPESAHELLAVATHKTNEEIEQALAMRFRRTLPQVVLQPSDPGVADESAAARLPVPCDASVARTRMEPVPAAPAAKHFGWRYAYSPASEEKLRDAQSLLAHARPGAGVDRLIDPELDRLKDKLAKQKFGKCSRPGLRRGSKNPRYIPLEVKRALGSSFMEGKRQKNRERSLKARAEASARAHVREQEQAQAASEAASQREVIPWLRALGCNLEAARTAAARCTGMVGVPLEERVFVACRGLAPRGTRRRLHVGSGSAPAMNP